MNIWGREYKFSFLLCHDIKVAILFVIRFAGGNYGRGSGACVRYSNDNNITAF